MLRVYDVTFVDPRGSNTSLSFDVESRAAPVLVRERRSSGRVVLREIGLRTPSGHFLPLVRSNAVTTPRATPSPDREARWLEFGPTGPAWSTGSRGARPATAEQPSDGQRVPGR